MTRQSQVQENNVLSTPQCRHHWVIESPQGATSRGVCRLCGAEREFPNSAQDSLWEGEASPSSGSGRWSRGDSQDSFRDEQDMGATVSYATWVASRPEDDDSF